MSKDADESELEVDCGPQSRGEPVTDVVGKLKKQKRVNKMQLTKLYTRLVRVMSDEETDQESILQVREAFEMKKFETLEIIDELISTYRHAGEERSAIKTEEELDNVSTDADRDIASVKAFLSTTFTKPSTPGSSLDMGGASEKFNTTKRNQEQRVRQGEMDIRIEKTHKDQPGEPRKERLHLNVAGKNTRSDSKDLQEETNPQFEDIPGHSSWQKRSEQMRTSTWRSPVNNKPKKLESRDGIDRKMQPIHIPKFKGDKTKFEYFWAAFTTIVDESDEHPKYKMIRLKSCLEGRAEEAIAKLEFSEEAYEEAKKTLQRKFGGDRRQIQNYLDELRHMPPLQERNIDDVEKFTDHLVNTVVMLQEQRRWSELNLNSMLYTLIIEKIPRSMLSNYFRWSTEHYREESLETLRDWMVDETEYRVRALECREGLIASSQKKPFGRRQQRSFATMHGSERSRFENRRACVCCEKTGHRVWDCHRFIKDWSVDQRWKLAKERQLCFRCLCGNHQGKDCIRSKECGIDDCKNTHHKLLHGPLDTKLNKNSQKQTPIKTPERSLKTIPDSQAVGRSKPDFDAASDQQTYMTTLTSAEVSEESLSFRTVPVWLKANGRKLKVNAVLDDASSASYMNEEVAGALGLSVPYESVTVQVLNESVETFDAMPVDLILESSDGNVKVPFSALTCPRQITGKYKVVDWRRHQARWPHLQVCNFPEAATDSVVDVLIGQDHIDLHYSRCDVKGQPGEPLARLGPLGWSCIGYLEKKDSSSSPRTNLAYTFFTRPQVFDEINQSLKRFWEVDSLGTQPQTKVLTNDEKLALNKVRSSLENDGERYQVAVPWLKDRPTLENNYEMALSRLQSTEKRLLRQERIGEDYGTIISAYERKGYIHKVDQLKETKPDGHVWYLPHFPVCRPEKATTKTRIVFDASAKYHGTSLNDEILPGPKLQNSLFDVLMRFRRFPVAVACDIKEMYLQVRIPEQDRSYFRFLWRDLEPQRRPDVYEFERMVFGDASAPFRAQFVSQENAESHRAEFPLAAETVKESTYMDDSLDSVKTDEAAIELYQQLTGLWGKAGMEPRKWLPNSSTLLAVIPKEYRASEIDLNRNSLPATKTLGVLWLASTDVFSFQVVNRLAETCLTKRTILSKVATIFDPLGFLSPFIARAKIILQELWSKGLEWDDSIDAETYNRVKTWLEELEVIQTITVPRCLQKSPDVKSTMILTFVDASNDAYGAVSYYGTDHEDGSVSVIFIASKTRVIPSGGDEYSAPRASSGCSGTSLDVFHRGSTWYASVTSKVLE